MALKNALLALAVASLSILSVVGCGSGDKVDPNYEQKVTLTPEQKAQAEANMAGQKAPGAAGSSPGTMAMPKGKG